MADTLENQTQGNEMASAVPVRGFASVPLLRKCVQRPNWQVAALFFVLTAFLILPGSYLLPLVDRDEPRFAQATREMMERGDWVVPWFNGEYRFDKPPLIYWAMRATYALGGINEWTARLPSVLSAGSVAFLIFLLGARLYSRESAFVAGVGWLMLLQVHIHGRMATADMLMMHFVVLTHWAVYELLREKRRPFSLFYWLLYLGIALGFLTKWVVVPAVLVFNLLLLRFVFWRKPLPWLQLQPFSGLAIAGLIVALWAVPAYVATEGAFFAVGIGEHVVERGVSSFNHRMPLPGFYLLTALLSLFPWILLAPLAWQTIRQPRSLETAWLTSWLVGPYVMFSIAMTQLPHYVMPAFPAFVLLVAVHPRFAEALRLPSIRRVWMGAVFLCMLLMLVAVYLGWLSGFYAPALLFGVMLSLLMLLKVLTWDAQHDQGWLQWGRPVALLLGIALLYVMATWQLRAWHIAHRLAAPGAPLATLNEEVRERIAHGYSEPILISKTGLSWQRIHRKEEFLQYLETPPAEGQRIVVVLLREYSIDRLLQHALGGGAWDGGLPEPSRNYLADFLRLQEKADSWEIFSGINLGRFSWVEVAVFIQTSE